MKPSIRKQLHDHANKVHVTIGKKEQAPIF